MLSFVNLDNKLSFQEDFGIPNQDFGLELALKNRPLNFQYESSESVTSFLAISVDSNGHVLDSINLSTSLISSNGTYHICNGLVDYSVNLECGIYYFLVNSKYKSEYFQVFTELVQGSLSVTPISVSGLGFYDNTIQIPWREKIGAPIDTYGIQYLEDSNPLPFRYFASDSVSSFKITNLTTGIETNLTSSLVSSDGTYHYCSGLVNFSSDLECGIYFFTVNDRYESELFATMELNNYYLLLESGDFLLKEDGYKLILE